jgi:tRNA (guanine-N7-)-methyltransferase
LEKLPDNSLDKLFVLFPDPWPKTKHNKRRIINEEFLQLVIAKLKQGGKFLFASDIYHYIEWTIDYVHKAPELIATFSNIDECRAEPRDWIKTRFQEKATKEGRVSYFLEFEEI